MIGHQRNVLSTLGIELWIPRESLSQKCESNRIWRDQVAAEIIDIQHSLAPEPILQPSIALPQATLVQPTVEQLPIIAPVQDVAVVREMLEVAAFSLQSLTLEHCVLLIDATHLNLEQQTLWANIQRAVPAEFNELQWPFAWEKVQDGRGVASYIAGFIDASGQDKNIICLGEIAYMQHPKVTQLASLQQMLEQPLLKKRLWQFMQNRPHMDA